MKAVIFLRSSKEEHSPLIEDPACMVRLCGRPLMEYNLELLAACGVRECTFVTKDGLEKMRAHFPKQKFAGISLHFCSGIGADQPAAFSQTKPYPRQPVLIMDDRILCDFVLEDMVRAHQKDGADLTMAVICEETGLGSLKTASNGTAESLSKTDIGSWNAGIYILSPHTADIIRQGKKTAFGNVFAAILQSGVQITTWNGHGYWRCIDSLQSYQQAQRDLLDGKVRCKLRGIRDERGNLIAGHAPSGIFQLLAPVFIGAGVALGNGAIIRAGSVLDDRCTVASGAVVENGTLLPCSFVGEHGCVKSGVVCAGAAVKSGTVLLDSIRSCPPNPPENSLFDQQNTLMGEVGVELTPELAVRIGCALGTAARGQTVGIAAGEFCSSRVLSSALAAGIRSAGTSILDFGCAFESLFRFAMHYNALKIGVCLNTGKTGSIKIVENLRETSELPLGEQLQSILAQNRFSRAPWDGFGGCVDMSGIGAIYRTELLRLAPDGLADMQVQVTSPNRSVQKLLAEAMLSLGCDLSGGILVHVSRDGMDLFLSDQQVRLDSGLTAALEKQIQMEMDRNRQESLRTRTRISLFGQDTDGQENWTAGRQRPAKDGLMLAVRLLDYMRSRHLSLAELESMVSDFTMERVYAKKEQKENSIPEERMEKKGILLLCPQKKENSKRMFAEIPGWELAQGLCKDTGLEPNGLLDNERRNG